MNEQFFLGYPVEFKNLCLVYPPKVKDVVANKAYGIYSRVLTFSQEEIEDEFFTNILYEDDIPEEEILKDLDEE